ncbi:Target of EGR1, member 1 (Nuclear) [Entomortierella beljakovae]|nr:Target of EGR1, member 1 (Nuclear) [Entomortierella beljakovae]
MPPAQLPLPTYNQVTKYNLVQLQPVIVLLLKQAAFISLDAEFTGLGPKTVTTRATDIQERYQHLCSLAKSHALVAFGLSIFIKPESKKKATVPVTGESAEKPSTDDLEYHFQVHNFNFSMLSEEDYSVSPRSMIFLAENGLDLNQWVLEGIPYTGGSRLTNEGGRGNPNGIMRSIFSRIMSKQVPVVIHNGFYADLPPKLATFVADLSDMFPGGLFDTKYISDYITRERSSFLAYLFRKYERANSRAKDDPSQGSKKPYSTFDVQPRFTFPSSQDTPTEIPQNDPGSSFCEDYAYHGVCKKNMKCGRSHDLDLILDAEEEQRSAKKRKVQKQSQIAVETQNVDLVHKTPNVSETSSIGNMNSRLMSTADATVKISDSSSVQTGEKFHSAYFDAFMTGTIFSYQLNHHGTEEIEAKSKNNIYLIGKNFPLKIEKSAFSKYSSEHERLKAQ